QAEACGYHEPPQDRIRMIVPRRPLTVGQVADHYQDLDWVYRLVWGEHVHHGLWRTGTESPGEAVEQLVELVAAEAHIQRGESVCDIGSGYGASARYIAAKCGAQVTALTIVPAQYEFALKATSGDNPRYLLRD